MSEALETKPETSVPTAGALGRVAAEGFLPYACLAGTVDQLTLGAGGGAYETDALNQKYPPSSSPKTAFEELGPLTDE